MPNIPVYENQVDTLQPSDRGAQAFDNAARREGALYREGAADLTRGRNALTQSLQNAGDVATSIWKSSEDAAAQKEISAGYVNLAKMDAARTAAWNDVVKNTDPNDIGAAAHTFMGTLDQDRETFLKSFTTQKGRDWADRQWAEHAAHMVHRTIADSATAAGDAVAANLHTGMNAASQGAYADPTSLDSKLKGWNDLVNTIVGSTPNLGAAQAAKARTEIVAKGEKEIVLGGIRGAIDNNPDAALPMIDKYAGAGKINGEESQGMRRYAETIKSKQAAENRQADADQKRGEKEQFNTEMNSIKTSVITPNGTVQLPPNYLDRVTKAAQMPGAKQEPGAVETAINFYRSITEEQAKGIKVTSNPTVYEDFASRAFRPANDTSRLTVQEIDRARVQRQLSDHDWQLLHQSLDDNEKNPQHAVEAKQLDEFLKGYKSYITKSTMLGADPAGDQRFYEFQRDMTAQFMAARQQNIPVESILKTMPPLVAKYQPSTADVLSHKAPSIDPKTGQPLPVAPLPAIQPWKPSESLDDLMKRYPGK